MMSVSAEVNRPPAVSGPISGGDRGRPFTSATFDLSAFSYIEEEYFIEGEATIYGPAPATTFGSDGAWNVVPADAVPYTTRILVRRPATPNRFNGSVVVEWQNVSGGFDIDAAWLKFYEELLRSGYAWVGVSAQRAGVHLPPVIPGLSQPLTVWDPVRYASLSIPDDAASYDIFSDAIRVVGPDRSGDGVDPLGGLPVDLVLAVGQSQSGSRLATYVNAIHPVAQAADGFMVMARSASSAPLATSIVMPAAVRIRADLDVPVLALNTETEVISYFAARQPDTSMFRYWEVAGSAHQSASDNEMLAVQFQRDLGIPLVADCDNPINNFPFNYAANAALANLNEWASGGPPAPTVNPISVTETPLAVQRDALGNALGGLRLPHIDAPTAAYDGIGTPLACRLQGAAVSFTPETLRSLYPNHVTYLTRFTQATNRAVTAGVLLRDDAAAAKTQAAHTPIP